MPPRAKAKAQVLTQFARDHACKYKFGAHVAMAGGISRLVENAARLGAHSFALFLKSPRRWDSPAISSDEAARFKQLCAEHRYDPLTDVLPHGSYFINLGNPDPEKMEKSYNLFLDDLRRCEQLGIGLYNFHPGLSVDGDHAEAIERLARNINRAIADTQFVKIVVENMAGHGNLLGLLLQDLRDVIALVERKDRIGVCVDTCHAFAAGIDMRDQAHFDAFWAEFDSVVGAQYLSAIHLNDSKAPLGANRDLHQNLGLGFLGLETFRLIANCDRLVGIPIVLETPVAKEDKEDEIYGTEIKLLEWLVQRSETDPEYIEKRNDLANAGSAERAEQLKKFDAKKVKKQVKSENTKGSIVDALTRKSKPELLPETLQVALKSEAEVDYTNDLEATKFSAPKEKKSRSSKRACEATSVPATASPNKSPSSSSSSNQNTPKRPRR